MIANHIHLDPARLEEICRRYRVRRLSLFGSVLRDDFTADSDVDVLVEFEPETHLGLRFFELECELSELAGRRVDLNTKGFLGPRFRDEVISNAVVQYDARTR
jgi:predicted nucleotidyltransferase